ncbi:unnamed protein product, partial [Polarella glacialis]
GSSHQLMQRASTSLLGLNSTPSAAALPASGDTPITRARSRYVLRQQAQASADAVLQNSMPLLVISAIAAILMFCVGVYGIYAYVEVVWASLHYGDLPCDEPLSSYWLLTLAVASVATALKAFNVLRLCLDPQTADGVISSFINFLSTLVQVTCLQWLFASKTCSETNPVLFYAVTRLVYWQLFYLFVMAFLLGIIALALRRLVMAGVLGGSEGAGCAEKVKDMKHVPLTDNELMDPDDNKPRECVICMSDLSTKVGKEVVKTNC